MAEISILHAALPPQIMMSRRYVLIQHNTRQLTGSRFPLREGHGALTHAPDIHARLPGVDW
jgi:hypothetical protein